VGTVALRISELVIREILQLPANLTILAVAAEDTAGAVSSVVLTLDAPDAPCGAAEMTPVYQRERVDVPDRVELVAIDWHREDRTTIRHNIPRMPTDAALGPLRRILGTEQRPATGTWPRLRCWTWPPRAPEAAPAVKTGSIVHYVSYGTPAGEYGKECRAAIVTEVPLPGMIPIGAEPADVIGLMVANPTGQFFNRSIPHGAGTRPDAGQTGLCAGLDYPGGTWHWPALPPPLRRLRDEGYVRDPAGAARAAVPGARRVHHRRRDQDIRGVVAAARRARVLVRELARHIHPGIRERG
jgi:hypothetical protein